MLCPYYHDIEESKYWSFLKNQSHKTAEKGSNEQQPEW
jgi:hypothetical protein